MTTLKVKIRQTLGKKVKNLRKKDILPGVLYGPKIKTLALEVDFKQFERAYKEAGESSLISLELDDNNNQVLIYEVTRDALTGKFLHVDFFQPSMKEEIETTVLLVFEGEAPAVKNLSGTLAKNIQEVEVRALPQKLPKEIIVSIESLETFEDSILIKDLKVPEGVEILKDPEEVVAQVKPPDKAEEEIGEITEEKPEGTEEGGEKEETPSADTEKETEKKEKATS